MKHTLVSLGMSYVLFGVSCAPSTEQQIVASAPEKDEVRQEILISGANDVDVQFILQKNPQAKLRVLHKRTGTYGIQGVSEEELAKLLPGTALRKNANVDLNQKLDLSAAGNPAECAPAPRASKLNLKVRRNGKKVKDESQFELGDTVSISATKGGLLGFFEKEVKDVKWTVRGPALTSFANRSSEGATLEFVVSVRGPYYVIANVGPDARDCLQGVGGFGVTENVPYEGAGAVIPFETLDLFRHLPMIGASEAWNTSRGEDVVVAIVDSGVNYNHPHLSANIRTNAAEVAGNDLDDDGNGLVDDVVGWDFANGDAFPMDDNMHGTHVAGLAASAVSGVAPGAKILPVKVGRSFGNSDLGTIAAGILYSVDQGAKVINLSLGGLGDSSRWMKNVIEYVEKHDVLIVAAAGNGDYKQDGIGDDNDEHPVSPAGWTTDHVLAVAAVNLEGKLTVYSNYGLKSVDIAAPGGGVGSTDHAVSPEAPLYAPYYLPEFGELIAIQGTSMATPVTAGAAAVVLAADRSLEAVEVKRNLMSSVKKTRELEGKIACGGYLQVDRALQFASPRLAMLSRQ